MKKFVLLLISLFLLVLPSVLYGDNEHQPRYNLSLFGAIDFGNINKYYGFGGAAGYLFTPRIELEAEVYHMISTHLRYTGLSAALLANYRIERYKLCPYILGGATILQWNGGSLTYLMWGGGIRRDITRSLKLRFDLRFHAHLNGETDFWMKFSTGLMWSF